MTSILKILKILSDSTRVRILLLLESHSLTVAEMQEILSMGQSRISTQLAQLKQARLVDDRRSGKNNFYTLHSSAESNSTIHQLLDAARRELEEWAKDEAALRFVLEKRRDKIRAHFDELAGRFGRDFVPGRSWKSLCEAMLKLLPPMVIADLGAGEGTLSQLLAQRAVHVYAIDNSEKMVAYGKQIAEEHALDNLEYRLGDIEQIPLDDASVDLAVLSQALHHAEKPERAIREAFRIVRPGGRIVILDLVQHNFEQARELYADTWLGFPEVELRQWLEQAGFRSVESSIVDRSEEPPHFQTLLAMASKA